MSVNDDAASAKLAKDLQAANKETQAKIVHDLLIVQNRLYAQLESLSWLERALKLRFSLPPLRGWAASPDVLLGLHEHVRLTRPRLVVECGSGASTIVVADALRQNGLGKLVSLEHHTDFAEKTRAYLSREHLDAWVDLRLAPLQSWDHEHLGHEAKKPNDPPVRWYDQTMLYGLEDINLLFVDGPPGSTCSHARYPAMPALAKSLAGGAQVWMDDTVRAEEKAICEAWAAAYSFKVEYHSLEKGLGVLSSIG